MNNFYMLFRKGGSSPTHKHSDLEGAKREAKRIANECGTTVHVLVKTEEVHANAPPTVDEVKRHSSLHGRPAAQHMGLWLVVRKDGRLPEVAAVFVSNGGNALALGIVRGETCGLAAHVVEFGGEGAQWLPLTAEGKQIVDDDIPF